MYQMVSQGMQNNINPMDMFRQVTGNFNSQQMNSLMQQAKNMGFPEEVLNEVQNGVNTK